MNLGTSWHPLLKKNNNKKSPCRIFGCLRPAVTICPPFFPPSNRPVLDWTVPSGVQFLISEMKTKDIRESSPLTSVLLRLLQQWTPYRTGGWEELQSYATTAAPDSFGFDDTVVSVPGETGLLSAEASVRCRPPSWVLVAGAGVTAPSCFAPLVASRQNPRQAQNALGSATENLRYRKIVVWAPPLLHRAACRCVRPG